jgi:hypothetical protein
VAPAPAAWTRSSQAFWSARALASGTFDRQDEHHRRDHAHGDKHAGHDPLPPPARPIGQGDDRDQEALLALAEAERLSLALLGAAASEPVGGIARGAVTPQQALGLMTCTASAGT